jgi:hypothetical protein
MESRVDGELQGFLGRGLAKRMTQEMGGISAGLRNARGNVSGGNLEGLQTTF